MSEEKTEKDTPTPTDKPTTGTKKSAPKKSAKKKSTKKTASPKVELVDDPFTGSVKDEKTGKYHLPE